MAQSRTERIGTIYSRVSALLRTKAMKEEDKPMWLVIYEAFPPKYEPKFDRRLPSKPIKPIFYKEDILRGRFHKDQRFLPAIDLAKENVKSATQNFLSIHKTIKNKEPKSRDVYEQALQQYRSEVNTRMESKKFNQ